LGIFDKFIRKKKEGAQELQESASTIKTEISDVQANDLALAEAIYKDCPYWLNATTPAMLSSGFGALIAAEIARLITIESKVTLDSDEELNSVLQRYVMQNIRQIVEIGWALGGAVFKPYFSDAIIQVDANGMVKKLDGKMKIVFMYPSQFKIHKFDRAGEITAISFYTTEYLDYKYYTLQEFQYFDEKTNSLTITNTIYRSNNKPNVYKWDNLGSDMIPLESFYKWSNLLPKIVFSNVKATLIGYYKPAIANNAEITNPCGVSGLSRAKNVLYRIDKISNALDWEMEASLSRLYVDEIALNESPKNQVPQNLNRFLVKMLNTTGDGAGMFETFSPKIRDESYINVLNTWLRLLEDTVGLSHGTVSNVDFTTKTATEIATSRQRTYSTILDNQQSLEVALKQLGYAMTVWKNPLTVVDSISMTFDFDDGTLSNPAEQVSIMLQLQASGNIPKYKVNMTYFNINAEDAQKLVLEARGELYSEAEDDSEKEFE